MTTLINEWEFTADVVGWMNTIIQREQSLPFKGVKTEQRAHGSSKRRDITLLDRNGNIAVTGEIKLPDRKDGETPFNAKVVDDARAKAKRAGARFFFTWNINVCVLWETEAAGGAIVDRNYRIWKVAQLHKSALLTQEATQDAIRRWLRVFLLDLADVLRGDSQIGARSPDQKFMEALETALDAPIQFIIDELAKRYTGTVFKRDIDEWMRRDQGWTIYSDAEGIHDNLERAAKFASYTLVIKLVFYEALLKRFGKTLKKISVPAHIDAGDDLRVHLEGYFARARTATGDYETVFGEDAKSVGARIPFYANGAVPHWAALINSIHEFDFSKLDYEIIGNIFERLIAPTERHKYGQYYTRVEVVDLMNSFAVRTGSETVMDPACGGGTFLVRAYGRKRELAPERGHSALLADIFGVDQSHFATHLTTINLATRDLIDDENYPQVARSDFFDVHPQKRFLSLPTGVNARGLGKPQHRQVVIPPLDAIVANPPYVRQEDIPKASRRGQHGTKEYYATVAAHDGLKLSGRSDLHAYFWPHAASFLKPGGYLCFLTSSQWLDVEYGFKLQSWILDNFEIVAILESIEEPWFVGARVATTVTILRRQQDARLRAGNVIRFVQFRQPLADLVSHDGTMGGAVNAADALRDELLNVTADIEDGRYRCRLISQGKLMDDGVRLGCLLRNDVTSPHTSTESERTESEPPPDGANAKQLSPGGGAYYGGKWGVYVRAPDLWFDIVRNYGGHLAMFADVANLRRGVTSGKDEFFFPRDVSEPSLAAEPNVRDFEVQFGVARKDVKEGQVRLVQPGGAKGPIFPIESEYLEPEVHSLMEISGFIARAEDCARQILLVNKSKRQLKGSYVLAYVEWGEAQQFHLGSTCAARATTTRTWYDLTGQPRGQLFWPMSQQYKHAIPLNVDALQANHNLFDVTMQGNVDPEVMAGILNSSLVVLSKFQYGRPVGVEGNLKTEVIDATMMLVPDPRNADARVLKRIKRIFGTMKSRDALAFLSERRLRRMSYTAKGMERELLSLPDTSELDMKDRHELDDAVLELLGVPETHRRRYRTALYTYLAEFFEATRRKEEQAIQNKNVTRQRSTRKPADIALEIADEIEARFPHLLRTYDAGFLNEELPFDTYEVPLDGAPVPSHTLFIPNGVTFGTGKVQETLDVKVAPQVSLLVLLAENHIRGYVRVPHAADECERIERMFRRFVTERAEVITDLVEDRTGDEGLQHTIRAALYQILATRATGHANAAMAS